MKKFIFPILALVLIASGCLPNLSPVTDSPPAVDIQATLNAIVQTGAAETLAALPTLTPVPAMDTATPAVEPVSTDTALPAIVENLTTTPATATFGPEVATFTSTPVLGMPTFTLTLGVRLYGTLPPAVPYNQVTLVNKAEAEAYISLQLSVVDGKVAILEYPVQTVVVIDAPVGEYIYVAWVGGRKMVGTFTLGHDRDITINLYKTEVIVEQGE
jgi:hypothetical protein